MASTDPRHTSRAPQRKHPSLRSVVACMVMGAIATSTMSVATGLPVLPLDSSARGTAAAGVVAAGPGGEQTPTSLAITADAGPFHPVRTSRAIDYGAHQARFGASRGGRAHEGQDVFGNPGTPLIAVRDGVVVEKGDDGGRGNYVAIHSPAKEETYVYLHMRRPSWLSSGDPVAAGIQVGAMGCTGSCYGTHLHFEIRQGDDIEGEAIDPLPSLKRWPQAPEGG